jgi:hypothetical protein
MDKITPAYSLTIRTACITELKRELKRLVGTDGDVVKMAAVELEISKREKQCG